MTYQTQPGTMPHRVVQLLKSKPAGTELSTATMCEELGVADHQAGSLSAWLAPARAAGVLLTRTQPGAARMLFWSLGEGAPAMTERGEQEEDPPRRKAPEIQPRPGELLPGVRGDEPVVHERDTITVDGFTAPRLEPERYLPPMTLSEAMQAEHKPQPFDCWLSGVTGELVLQGVALNEDGDPVLTGEQVQAVRRVLLGASA